MRRACTETGRFAIWPYSRAIVFDSNSDSHVMYVTPVFSDVLILRLKSPD